MDNMNYTSNKKLIQLIDEVKEAKDNYCELKLLLKTTTNLLCIADTNGYFLSVSPEWIDSLGWSEEELLSRPYVEFVHPDDRPSTLSVADGIPKGKEVVNFANRYICKDGSYRWIAWTSTYLSSSNIIIASARDMTVQKELETKNLLLENSLYLQNLKSEFFTNMSHEFKTPLNIILATTQLLSNNNTMDLQSQNYYKYIKMIQQNSYRLLKLVNNLIDMTKFDAGFYDLRLGNYNIISIVEDITLSVVQYAENLGLTLIFDTDVEEKYMACDPEKIERVILNLLSNAIKYTDKNGVISVNIQDKTDSVIISVKDTGVGINKSNLETIFDRFIQGDTSPNRRCEGSGIGLSLVKSIVEMHYGTILAKSEEGIGSEFIIQLPVTLCESTNPDSSMLNASLFNPQSEKCNIEFSDIYSI